MTFFAHRALIPKWPLYTFSGYGILPMTAYVADMSPIARVNEALITYSWKKLIPILNLQVA